MSSGYKECGEETRMYAFDKNKSLCLNAEPSSLKMDCPKISRLVQSSNNLSENKEFSNKSSGNKKGDEKTTMCVFDKYFFNVRTQNAGSSSLKMNCPKISRLVQSSYKLS